MAIFSEQLALIAAARKNYAEAEQNLYRAKIAVQRSQGNIPTEAHRQELAGPTKLYNDTRSSVAQAIATLHGNGGITKVVAELDGHLPIMLFPLRLETRFGRNSTTGGSQLWIRIYPDDISVNRHERWLTEAEAEAGKVYWTLLLEAEKSSDTEAKRQAWNQLRERFGMQRALWTARQTKPNNWAERLLTALDFPIQDTKTHGWTRAPRSAALPDRFSAIFIQENKVLNSPDKHIGAFIPDTLILGPDPFDDDNSFSKTDGEIKFGEDFAWMADFQKAVEKGMGIVVDNPEQYMRDGKIERLYVVGILASATPTDSATLLADLLENHYYSSNKGFALVPQGTPTNNTEDSDSGFTRDEDWLAQGFFDDSASSVFTEKPDCDGQRLETALGIRAGVLDKVAKADTRDIEEALIMNRALYPATLGYFRDILMHTVLGEQTSGKLRRFFTNYVTGRGPLPTVRVGDQPYGVLLTSDLLTWSTSPNADPFYDGLLRVLRDFQQRWNQLVAAKVPYVGKSSGSSADEMLLEILALEPTSVAFRQRLGYMYDILSIASKTRTGFTQDAQNKHNTWMAYLTANGFVQRTNPPNKPLISHLFWQDNVKTVTVPAENLIDGLAPSETEPIPPIAPGQRNYVGRLLEWKTVEEFKNQSFGTGQNRSRPRVLLAVASGDFTPAHRFGH